MASNGNLINISIKVRPSFKETISKAAQKDDTLGIGNVSDFIRKAIQDYIRRSVDKDTDVEFLYNLLGNKFTLKANLTPVEKQNLEDIEKKIEDGYRG